jgi:hypothetical protein
MIRWRLVDYNTNEIIEDKEYLPQDWGPLFGIEGFKDRIHDLTWVGYPGKGWVMVKLPDPIPSIKEVSEQMKSRVNDMLTSCLDKVAADNTSITKGERALWVEYRQKLREIPQQLGFPYEIDWPRVPGVED